MKSLHCKDFRLDCDFVAYGETDEVVIATMFSHTVKHHLRSTIVCLLTRPLLSVADMDKAVRDA